MDLRQRALSLGLNSLTTMRLRLLPVRNLERSLHTRRCLDLRLLTPTQRLWLLPLRRLTVRHSLRTERCIDLRLLARSRGNSSLTIMRLWLLPLWNLGAGCCHCH